MAGKIGRTRSIPLVHVLKLFLFPDQFAKSSINNGELQDWAAPWLRNRQAARPQYLSSRISHQCVVGERLKGTIDYAKKRNDYE
jgi:hypothetical protein